MIQRITLLLCISVGSLLANTAIPQSGTTNPELSWVDSQVKAILPSRQGVSNHEINLLKEPFVFVSKPQKGSKVSIKGKYTARIIRHRSRALRVMLIINSKAMINGRWYKTNDYVRGYKISSIDTSRVVLKRHNVTKILSIQSDNKNIKINMK